MNKISINASFLLLLWMSVYSEEQQISMDQVAILMKRQHYAQLLMMGEQDRYDPTVVELRNQQGVEEEVIKLYGPLFQLTMHIGSGCIVQYLSRNYKEEPKDFNVTNQQEAVFAAINKSGFLRFSGLEKKGVLFDRQTGKYNDQLHGVFLQRMHKEIPVEGERIFFSLSPRLEGIKVVHVKAHVSFSLMPDIPMSVIDVDKAKEIAVGEIRKNVIINDKVKKLSVPESGLFPILAHRVALSFVHINDALISEDYNAENRLRGDVRVAYVVECQASNLYGRIYIDAENGNLLGGEPFIK